jgi:hypothetical protein
MNVISPLITNPQSAVAVQPCPGPLHHPAVAPSRSLLSKPRRRSAWRKARELYALSAFNFFGLLRGRPAVQQVLGRFVVN